MNEQYFYSDTKRNREGSENRRKLERKVKGSEEISNKDMYSYM